jgi:hypothetical protein
MSQDIVPVGGGALVRVAARVTPVLIRGAGRRI